MPDIDGNTPTTVEDAGSVRLVCDGEYWRLYEPCLGCARHFVVHSLSSGFKMTFGANSGYVLCERCTVAHMPGGWQPTWWRNNSKMHWQPFRIWLEATGATQEQAIRRKDWLFDQWTDGARPEDLQFWLTKDYIESSPWRLDRYLATDYSPIRNTVAENPKALSIMEAWAKLLEQFGTPVLELADGNELET